MPRRPVDSYRITGDTKEHASYGVGPATDYAAPVGPLPIGTPIKAPFAIGKLERWGGPKADGGFALNAYSLDGRRKFVAQHLSGYRGIMSAAEGDVIAYSGNSGTKTTGPHLHCYVVVDGVRMSMEEFMRKYAAPSAPASVAKGTAPRTARLYTNARATPTLGGKIVDHLNAGVAGTFDGYIRGAKVSQNGVTSDVWFRGAYNGRYYWAGNFTTRSTSGLKNLGTYKAPKPAAKPAPVKRAVLSAAWFYFPSALKATTARKGHTGPMLGAGSYPVTARTLGAVQVDASSRGLGRVWLHPKAAATIR